jgi:hypothetical protein
MLSAPDILRSACCYVREVQAQEATGTSVQHELQNPGLCTYGASLQIMLSAHWQHTGAHCR